MDHSLKRRQKSRIARVYRVRGEIRGTAERPRLTVSKTNYHIYAQLIDDVKGLTIAAIGTQSKANQGTANGKKSKASARFIGTEIAQIAKKLKIELVKIEQGEK